MGGKKKNKTTSWSLSTKMTRGLIKLSPRIGGALLLRSNTIEVSAEVNTQCRCASVVLLVNVN